MQVILLEKVVNLGKLGDVVRVKDGFARNFLIPQGMARRATDTAIADFEARRAELEKVQAEKLAAAQTLGQKMSGLVLEITQKAGVDGRLFGSVTNFDVAECLGRSEFFRLDLLKLCTTGLELRNRGVRSATGHALGNQKITRETIFHSDHIAELA